jgi:two-component system alkaline phosphatase synthesis response regulator PhoP
MKFSIMKTPLILVIEDDKILQQALFFALKDAGFKVHLASDGLEGVRIAKTENPDLILLDIIMPKRNGYSVLLDLKGDDALKAIPVIMTTVVGSEFSVKKCEDAGVKDYLIKSDYSLEEIVKKVKENLK